jgi:hypothetical protein
MKTIKIETGIPPPPKYRANSGLHLMREAIKNLKPGESFLWPSVSHPYFAASQVGAKITCRKDEKGGWRVWRIKAN